MCALHVVIIDCKKLKYRNFVVASHTNGFVSKFVKIHPAVLEIKHAEVPTDGQT
jgi:hypothetical protein